MTELSSMSYSNNINQSIPRGNQGVKLNFAYGDILGNTYVKSLEHFTENMSDSIKDFVFDYIDAITDGGHSLAKATECLIVENPSIIENFMPPSKKIKLNSTSTNLTSNQNYIIKKEDKNSEIFEDTNDNIPFKLTTYEIKQIENIINNIIVKKNYEYEQRELGLVESIIRDNHIDFLSVIEKEKVSSIIKDIISKHSKMNIDVNNKLVSDKLIKDYIESNIIELKIYKEMRQNRNRDIKKEAYLEYNIQKRFLEMLNISSNYGIDRIHKDNELQIKKLEKEIALKKIYEQNTRDQLQKQKLLEQEKAKQKEEALKKQLEQQRVKQQEKQKLKQQHERALQQKQLKNRQEIGKQLEQQLKQHQEQLLKQHQEELLRQRLEQQKINANQPTQFDPKKDQNKNLKEQQEKFLLLKNQQLMKSLQSNDKKPTEPQLKTEGLLEQLKINQQQQQQQNLSQIKVPKQSPLLKEQDKSVNSFGNISFGNLLNSRSDSATKQLLLQQQKQKQLMNISLLQTVTGKKIQNTTTIPSSTTTTPLLSNSKINTNTAPTAAKNTQIKSDTTNSNLTSLLTNSRLTGATASSANITSLLVSNQKSSSNSMTVPSSNLSSLISNNKNLLSDKVKNNISSLELISNINKKMQTTQSKTDYSAPYITVGQNLPTTQSNNNYSSLIASSQLPNNTKIVNYSALLSSDPKLKSQASSTTPSLSSNTKPVVTQPTPDFSSLLSSNPSLIQTSNITSLLANASSGNTIISPPSVTVGNKNKQMKQNSLPTNISTTQPPIINKSKTLPTEPDYSSLLGTATNFTTAKSTSSMSSLLVNAKVPMTQTPDSSLTSLLSNNKINLTKTQSGPDYSSLIGNTKLGSLTSTNLLSNPSEPDYSSLLLSKTKPQPIPSTTVPVVSTQSGTDFSSLIGANIGPSSQSLTDLIGTPKLSTTQSASSISLSSMIGNHELTGTSTAPSNLSTLLGNSKLTTSQPTTGFNTLLGTDKLATTDYSSLLGGVSVSNPKPATKVPTEPTGPDYSMLLQNSGIGSSSVVSSTISPYIIPSFSSSLPQTNLQLSLLQNTSLLNALQPSSSQPNLTSAFLTNNNIGNTAATTKTPNANLKSNTKNLQFPSYYF